MKTSSVYLLALMAGSSMAVQQQQQQHPFIHPMVAPHQDSDIVIHGKYLHITDIHVSESFVFFETINIEKFLI